MNKFRSNRSYMRISHSRKQKRLNNKMVFYLHNIFFLIPILHRHMICKVSIHDFPAEFYVLWMTFVNTEAFFEATQYEPTLWYYTQLFVTAFCSNIIPHLFLFLLVKIEKNQFLLLHNNIIIKPLKQYSTLV